MRRMNKLPGIVVFFIATLPAVLAGCTERDSQLDSGMPSAFERAAAVSNNLPEVVITAPRPRPKAIVLSQSAPGAAPSR
jgi:hypothetical protein